MSLATLDRPPSTSPTAPSSTAPAGDLRPGARIRITVPSGRVRRPVTLTVRIVELTVYPHGGADVTLTGDTADGPRTVHVRPSDPIVLVSR